MKEMPKKSRRSYDKEFNEKSFTKFNKVVINRALYPFGKEFVINIPIENVRKEQTRSCKEIGLDEVSAEEYCNSTQETDAFWNGSSELIFQHHLSSKLNELKGRVRDGVESSSFTKVEETFDCPPPPKTNTFLQLLNQQKSSGGRNPFDGESSYFAETKQKPFENIFKHRRRQTIDALKYQQEEKLQEIYIEKEPPEDNYCPPKHTEKRSHMYKKQVLTKIYTEPAENVNTFSEAYSSSSSSEDEDGDQGHRHYKAAREKKVPQKKSFLLKSHYINTNLKSPSDYAYAKHKNVLNINKQYINYVLESNKDATPGTSLLSNKFKAAAVKPDRWRFFGDKIINALKKMKSE